MSSQTAFNDPQDDLLLTSTEEILTRKESDILFEPKEVISADTSVQEFKPAKLKEERHDNYYDDTEDDIEQTSEKADGLSASSGILELVKPTISQKEDNLKTKE